jgi:hypothetical protein
LLCFLAICSCRCGLPFCAAWPSQAMRWRLMKLRGCSAPSSGAGCPDPLGPAAAFSAPLALAVAPFPAC